MPDSALSVGDSAYYDCDLLTEFIAGNGCASIGSSAFYSCDKLANVDIGDNCTGIGEYAFYQNYALQNVDFGSNLKTIDSHAFDYCSALTEISLPDTVTSIGGYAFNGCTAMTVADLGSSVQSIGSYAFQNCDKLTEITLTDTVLSIGNYCFESCDSLTTVNIGKSLIDWGTQAFANNHNLTKINFADGLKNIGRYTGNVSYSTTEYYNSGTRYYGSSFYNCDGLKEVVIPDSVTDIWQYAFGDCDMLKKVFCGASLERVGCYAFYSCNMLDNITFISDALTVGTNAFSSSGLKTIYALENSGAAQYAVNNGYKLNVVEPTQLVIEKYPDKLHYVEGETFDPEGMKARIYFNNGMSRLADGYTYYESLLTPENTSVVIMYMGKSAVVPVYVVAKGNILPSNAPFIKIGDVSGVAGDTVEVEMDISNNIGFSYLKFAFEYDCNAMKLVAVNNNTTDMSLIYSSSEDGSCLIMLNSFENHLDNGTLVTLTFKILDDAVFGSYTLNITDCITRNSNEELTAVSLLNGTVHVRESNAVGDIDGDGNIASLDLLMLRQTLIGEKFVIKNSTDNIYDTNGDGELDSRDIVRLKKYLAGVNVTLG